MATLSDVLTFARAQAQTDTNGLTNANGIIFANSRLVDFHRQLVAKGVDASQLQEAYVPTVTPPASGNGSTFTYPTNCLALKTIEVNFTDTSAANYIRAEQVDVSNLPNQAPFSQLRINQSTMFPLFDDRGDWYEIFPAFTSSDNLTNAIRLFYYLKPTLYTSVSDNISYPISQDDGRGLGWGIAADYYYSLNKFEEGAVFDQKYQDAINKNVTTMGRGSSQPIQAVVTQYGNNGWNL